MLGQSFVLPVFCIVVMAILSTAAQKDVEILKLKEKVKITATGRCTFRSTPEDDLVNVTVKFSIPIKKLKAKKVSVEEINNTTYLLTGVATPDNDNNSVDFTAYAETCGKFKASCYVGELECDEGFTPYGESCYRFEKDAVKNWGNAMSACEADGGYLVEIEDEEENMFVKSLISEVGSEVWLGATDADTEGEWLWAKSKTPVDAINWSVGQPDDNRGREDCMLMMEPNPRNRRAWNDDQCVKELNYVCEMPKM